MGLIGSAALTFIGYKKTNRQTDRQTDKPNLYIDCNLKFRRDHFSWHHILLDLVKDTFFITFICSASFVTGFKQNWGCKLSLENFKNFLLKPIFLFRLFTLAHPVFSTVKSYILKTSKVLIKCRILHFLIMECCRYLVF